MSAQGLTDAERQNVQRRLNASRTNEIAELHQERPNATFPTSIIVAADGMNLHFNPIKSTLPVVGKEIERYEENGGEQTFEPLGDDGDSLGLVIDGQHRIKSCERQVKQRARGF